MALNGKKRLPSVKVIPIPNLDSTQNDLSNEVMLEEIEREFRWIKSEIQPYFSRRIKKTNGVREITQEKLTDFLIQIGRVPLP